jgi:hypothetical protein
MSEQVHYMQQDEDALIDQLESLTQYKEPSKVFWGLGDCGDDGWTPLDPRTKKALIGVIRNWFGKKR